MSKVETLFHDALSAAKEKGELAQDVEPRKLSRTILTLAIGVAVLNRLPGTNGRVEDIVEVAQGLLGKKAATTATAKFPSKCERTARAREPRRQLSLDQRLNASKSVAGSLRRGASKLSARDFSSHALRTRAKFSPRTLRIAISS